jgi:hypothetical protein
LEAQTYLDLHPDFIEAIYREKAYSTASGAEHAFTYQGSLTPGPVNNPKVAQITMLPDDGEIEFRLYAQAYLRGPHNTIVRESYYFPDNFAGTLDADANRDFAVDAADLASWTSHAGATADATFPNSNDVEADGDNDYIDLATVLAHIGQPGTRADGDVTGNGQVDIDDTKVAYLYPGMQSWNVADFNDDLVVDGNDFLVWQREVGHGFVQPTSVATVPEPASVALTCFWGLLFAKLGKYRRVANAAHRDAGCRRRRLSQ